MSIKKKLQVFVSSTYRDLKIERQAAVEAILKAGHIPAGMELFSAGSESQLEIIRRWIDESDVYMLILGGRYGSVEPKTSLSYTELEYDYAVSKEIPIFAVVIKDEALDAKVAKEGKDVLEIDNAKELKLFREKVLSRISSFFTDTKDIKLAVHETLADIQARYTLAGWVPARDLPDTTTLVEELQKLRTERDEAQAELKRVKVSVEKQATKSTKQWTDEEFDELIDLLRGVEITTKVFNKNPGDAAVKVNVLRIVDVVRDMLITGVTNQINASDRSSLLYYNVCPKLEMHGLAALEKVSGVAWQRYRLTPKGMSLLIHLDKRRRAATAPTSEREPATPTSPSTVKRETPKPSKPAQARTARKRAAS
jgi:hypothetical protein